jgi:tetratricopeptide (TPR) repeat protein
MRKASFVLSAALALAGVTGTVGILLVPSVAMAQQKVSAKVGVPLKAAQEAIQKKKWDQALAKIKEADGISSKTAFDQYKINDMLWYVYLQQGRNADAARILEGQINSAQMPAGEKAGRTKTLAQLYFRAGNYGKAAQIAKTMPGDKDMQMIVATSAYQQKDYKGAIAAADKVIKAGGQPSQELLQLVLRSNYELKDAAGTTAALEQLLKYYPSADTWSRVLDGYFQNTKHDDALMALYRLAEDTGTLNKPRMYTDMAQALILGGFGIEGERIIQKGLTAKMFTGDDLGRAQRTLDAAKKKADAERALLPKAPAMLASAKTGEDMFTVGKLYFSNAEYAKAQDALTKAIAKGGIQDTDAAQMLLAVSLARQGKKAEAGKAFDGIKDPKFAEIGRLYKMSIR